MGRLTELFDYLNKKDHPTTHQIKHQYHYVHINKDLKKIRKDYKKGLIEPALPSKQTG